VVKFTDTPAPGHDRAMAFEAPTNFGMWGRLAFIHAKFKLNWFKPIFGNLSTDVNFISSNRPTAAYALKKIDGLWINTYVSCFVTHRIMATHLVHMRRIITRFVRTYFLTTSCRRKGSE